MTMRTAEGGLTGFMLFSKQSMTAKAKGKKRQRAVYIEMFWISISPEHRSKGGGSSLLAAGLRRAQELWADAASVRLHVMANNAAVRFYERHGFETSVRKEDYPPGYCSLRMVKTL